MSTRKSLAFSFLDRYASLFIGIVSSMIIARLLSPGDIGVFSVTMVLLAFVATVRDLGAGQYLVQEKELTTDRIRAVWAVQLGLGLLLACVVLVASEPVSRFYSEPRMKAIMLVVALTYAINPFGSLTFAWQMRAMRFDIIAVIRFSATLAGAVISALLAWRGYGPISLALGSLASTVVNALMATFFRPPDFPWLPGVREIKRVLSFGSRLTATSILNTGADGAPELLLGKLQNMTATGLYSRAHGLVSMVGRLLIDTTYSVAMSWFAKHSREKGNFAEPFLRAISYVSALGWSLCLAIVLLAHPIVRLLYGAQWDQSVDVARLLAVGMLCNLLTAICLAALVAAGAVTKIFHTTLVSTVVAVALAFFGAYAGLFALGFAMLSVAFINGAIWMIVAQRVVQFSWRNLWGVFSKSALVAITSAIVPFGVFAYFGPRPEGFILPLALGGSGGLAGFIFAVLVFNHPLGEELRPTFLKVNQWLTNG